ncbi:MAG: ComF family protein [Flavobacteriaceae bacterium]|nr:ComF family protein [Flavobacteriaceae bacterium]
MGQKNHFSILTNVYELFFPRVCVSCGNSLMKNEPVVCLACLHQLPLTFFNGEPANDLEKTFYGRLQVEFGTALLYYHPKGISQRVIHQLKYKGQQQVGTFFGTWLGNELLKTDRFPVIDCIVPVPLDRLKMKKRGYNQLTTFGLELSRILQVPYIDDKLIRKSARGTQTKKNRLKRWQDINEQFIVKEISFFDNKHVLLIDDVITTGATLEACAKALLRSQNLKISIATMAYAE